MHLWNEIISDIWGTHIFKELEGSEAWNKLADK